MRFAMLTLLLLASTRIPAGDDLELSDFRNKMASVQHILRGTVSNIGNEVKGHQQFAFEVSEDIKGVRARCDREPPAGMCGDAFIVILRTTGSGCTELLPLTDGAEYLFLWPKSGVFVARDGFFDCSNLRRIDRKLDANLAIAKRDFPPGRAIDVETKP